MATEWKNGVGKREWKDGRYSFVIKYRDRQGRQQMEALPAGHTRKSAEAERAKRLEQTVAGVAPGTISFAAWADQWLELIDQQEGRTASTRDTYAMHLKSSLVPYWGRMKIREITAPEIQLWVDKIRPTASASTVGSRVMVLGLVMRDAAKRGLVAPLDMSNIDRPSIIKEPPEVLSAEELDRFIECFDPYWQPDVAFMAFTGLRRSELSALLDADVDLQDRSMWIHRSYSRLGEVTAPKHGHKRRVELYDRAITAYQAKRELKLEAGVRGSELAFPTRRGGRIRWELWVGRYWDPACQVFLGKPRSQHSLRMTPHMLRHTAATLMIGAGMPIEMISAQLGHRSTSITRDIYIHWLAERSPEYVAQFDAYYAKEGR